jgi:flagellar hook protein FlgE
MPAKSAALQRVTTAVSWFTGGMIDALGIAASALNAQTISVAVTADNVANARTPGFTAKQAQFVAMNPGVTVGAIIDNGQGVDLADQMVNLILAKTAYAAVARVFRTADQMSKTLLAAI